MNSCVPSLFSLLSDKAGQSPKVLTQPPSLSMLS